MTPEYKTEAEEIKTFIGSWWPRPRCCSPARPCQAD